MPRTIFAGIALAMSIFFFMSPLFAQTSSRASESSEIATLEQPSREAFAAENWGKVYVANLKLNQLRPGEVEYLVNAVRACGMLDRRTSAYHLMLEMQKEGMAFNFNSVPETEQIRGTQAYEYINDMLIDAGKPAGVGMPVFTLQGNPGDFSSIAWDSSREKFLVGTKEKGEILAVTDTGKPEVLIEAGKENGLWSITGLAVDSERSRLWVSSAAMPAYSEYSDSDKNLGALVEFDLESLELLGRYDLPSDSLVHEIGSVAVTDNGTVYVIDRAAPIVYRKAPGGNQLVPFFSSPELVELTDIAVVPDDSRLFISDAAKGVMVVDPVAEQAALVSGTESINLAGAMGVEFRQGQLFVVQGAFTPPRVVRLALDNVSGSVVESISPMANALEFFNQPGIATIRGDDLFYFANTGDAEGSGAIVVSTPLDAGSEVAPPDMGVLDKAQ
jgi:hypothetical protein